MSGLNELGKEAYRIAKARGQYDGQPNAYDLVSRLNYEVEEARDESVWGTVDAFALELADVVIMVSSIAEHAGIDLDDAVARKMKINEARIPSETAAKVAIDEVRADLAFDTAREDRMK